mgnify:CR=1 FL=1
MQKTYKDQLLMSDTTAIATRATDLILQGNSKFHTYFQEISTYTNSDDIHMKISIILLDNLDSPYAKYVIRKLFTPSYGLSLYIASKLKKILGSQQSVIDLLLINYQDCDARKVYRDARHIHETNVSVLKQIGYIYGDHVITPNIQDIIYLCDDDEIIMELFYSNKLLWLPMLKHMIYTRNQYAINYIVHTAIKEDLIMMIELLDQPYNEDELDSYVRNMNILARKADYSNPWKISLKFPTATHLYGCLISLLEYNTIRYIFDKKIHLKYIRFSEYCCDRVYKLISNEFYSLDSLDVHYSILKRILERKCLTKRMLKFGAYESPDNLNERHLVDLIMTFVK